MTVLKCVWLLTTGWLCSAIDTRRQSPLTFRLEDCTEDTSAMAFWGWDSGNIEMGRATRLSCLPNWAEDICTTATISLSYSRKNGCKTEANECSSLREYWRGAGLAPSRAGWKMCDPAKGVSTTHAIPDWLILSWPALLRLRLTKIVSVEVARRDFFFFFWRCAS